MNQGFSAASCVSHQGPRFVWISDALLADTLNRFCRHKRYGSSVPGPLEAQRRATKRKNTSLAHYSPGGSSRSIDPTIVLGNSSKIDWWQPQPEPRANVEREPNASRLLPSWLFSDSNPSQAERKTQNTRHPTHRKPDAPKTIVHETRQAYEEDRQLDQCRSLGQIRAWLKEQGINVRDDTRIGETISQHLLAQEFEASEIAAYLCDPAFHPAGTSFHRQMLPGLLARTWDFRSWHAVGDAFCKAAELGLISVGDLRAIIVQVADAGPMSLVKDNGKVQLVKSTEKERLVRGLLTAVAHSRVLTLADLGRDFLSRLLRKIGTKKRLTATSQCILWTLSPWASERDALIISRLVMMHLRARCRNDTSEEVGLKLMERLAKVGIDALQLALLQTTESLIRHAQEDTTSSYVYLFHHWTGTLALLGSKHEVLHFTKDIWIAHSTTTSDLSAEQRSLAFAWTLLCLGKRQRMSLDLSERLSFLETFEETLKLMPNLVEAGSPDRAILALGSLPLPNKHILQQHLSRLTERGSLPVVPESDSASHIDGFRRRSFSLFLDYSIYQKARLSHNDVMIELAESLNHDLPLFKTLSRKMIQKNPLSFEIISRLLENNLSIKLALSRVWPQQLQNVQQDARFPDEVLSEATKSSHPVGTRAADGNILLETSSEVLSPAAALDLVNHLAVSFATSTVTSPRASLRRVYWCYMFLHRYGGPVQPVITRALWYVGVTRYGESGTSRTLLRWILWQVKQTEGEDVARSLLWSQSLRELWRQDLEDMIKAGVDEKQFPAGFGANENTERAELTLGTSADLETLRRIRFVKTEPEERLIFLERSRRREAWEKAQARRSRSLD